METTWRRTAGEGTLIGLDPAECTPLGPGHRVDIWCRCTLSNNRHTVSSISANVCSQAGTRAPTRYRPGGTSHAASTARSRRRRRFLDTADPTARPMAKATWGGARSGSRTNEHHSGSVRTRTPSRRRRAKASRSRTRSIKPRDVPGPWPGGTSGPLGRRECSCAHGNRACGLDDADWVGRYASRLTPDDSRQIMFRRRPPRSWCASDRLTWQG